MSILDNQGASAPALSANSAKPSQANITSIIGTAAHSAAPICYPAINPHKDARAIIRLIQCTQCSLPLQNPLTLPCGNSICKKCLPDLHQREHITYPNHPSRHESFICPFGSCGKGHVLGDCSQDVTLSKIMDRLSVEVAKCRPLSPDTPTLLDERLHWRNMIDSSKDERVPSSRVLNGGRLLATYTLAEMGELRFDSEVAYQTMSTNGDEHETLDIGMLNHLKEATKSELDCQVCYALVLDPLTTNCGHTYCRKCVARILDHSHLCPICRRPLRLPPVLSGIPSNQRLSRLLSDVCPDLVVARQEAAAREEAIVGHANVPLFVCTLSFPEMPTFLHVFEPRYRLMMRRAMEFGDRKFGMVMYNNHGAVQGDLGSPHFMQYGTMLHINSMQMHPDGRSMLETRGVFRFRIKSSGHLDGYITGDVEPVQDIPLAEEEAIEVRETTMPPAAKEDIIGQIDRMPTLELLRLGTDFVTRTRQASAPWLRGAHLASYGDMPHDPALFPYWFASVLPIIEDEKYKLLPTTSVRERLKITAIWVKKIEAQKWDEIGDDEDIEEAGYDLFEVESSSDSSESMPGLEDPYEDMPELEDPHEIESGEVDSVPDIGLMPQEDADNEPAESDPLSDQE